MISDPNLKNRINLLQINGLTLKIVNYLNYLFFLIFLLAHFVTWMRTAGLPNFRKTFGRIDTDLVAGT